ncbi:MAG: 4Fe-4S dicluster domain-containing protein [Coriobacteriales bacterium]|nr:4Fe-4S dicluster domain-containing protein [Coriobacteriales bacterium]
MSIGFAIDSKNCIGCKACTQACANEHLQRPGVYNRRVRRIEAGEDKGFAFVSMSCNHCDDPQCLKVCPVGAYSKMEDGSVIQNHDRCIGCQSCVFACPFHAPVFDEVERAVYKCDSCIKRRNAGMLPRCVVTCPEFNIAFGEMGTIANIHSGAVSTHDVVASHPIPTCMSSSTRTSRWTS